MLATLRAGLFGTSDAGTATPGGLFGFGREDESPADQFASWLPYQSYLEDEQLFVNRDTGGSCWIIRVPVSGKERYFRTPDDHALAVVTAELMG